MGKLTVLGLRAVMVTLHAGSVCAQAVMVLMLTGAIQETVLADRRAPVLLIAFLGVMTVQVVLVCVWRLVTMVQRGTVFSHAAFRYVHLVICAFVAAALLVFALGAVLASGHVVPPGVVALLGGVCLAVFGIALIVLVLRMLLAQAVARDAEASQLGAELAEVI
ncbi:DUF2975 domain-containing protein [Streptomyces noursei]|uniref:DUF2975 domain-containing protein n=1 Tax=Streptomyces noursei TaxID=1971 RepID=UPI00167B7175|nr:DUF2975 domain-containing protein [Streptomyces noursei]MCZ1013596.1 DUF2975 domain-containing protein [Streptomyces noursei]GGX25550.1 transporter [Streptomyces noursei]